MDEDSAWNVAGWSYANRKVRLIHLLRLSVLSANSQSEADCLMLCVAVSTQELLWSNGLILCVAVSCVYMSLLCMLQVKGVATSMWRLWRSLWYKGSVYRGCVVCVHVTVVLVAGQRSRDQRVTSMKKSVVPRLCVSGLFHVVATCLTHLPPALCNLPQDCRNTSLDEWHVRWYIVMAYHIR